MRSLEAAPSSFYDDSGSPRFGSYRGALPPVDLGRLASGKLDLITKRKRWVYFAIANERYYVAAAAVHVGYAASLFAFVFDREAGMLFDGSTMLLPIRQRFVDPPRLSFRGWNARLLFDESSPTSPRGTHYFYLRLGDLSVVADLDHSKAPQPISVIGRVPGGVVSSTEKRPLLGVCGGQIALSDRKIDLSWGLAGYDYTHGLLARRTTWKWAFLLGRAKTGEKIAMNLVEGFLGESECAVWVDDRLYPVGEGRFVFDPKRPLEPWKVASACGAVDLTFSPGGMHAEDKNFGVIRSHFIQPVGTYAGTIRLPDRAPLELEGVLGVTEDQDVLW